MFSTSEVCYTREALISQGEARSLIDLGETLVFADAAIEGQWNGPHGFLVTDGRHNHRAAIEDGALSEALWHRVKRFIPENLESKTVVGLNERLRFYRYTPGQQFAPHQDGYYLRSERERSLLTLIMYLNEGYVGGETFFLNSETLVAPQTGKVLVFAHQLWHEGLPVLSGVKYILRTDVIYR